MAGMSAKGNYELDFILECIDVLSVQWSIYFCQPPGQAETVTRGGEAVQRLLPAAELAYVTNSDAS